MVHATYDAHNSPKVLKNIKLDLVKNLHQRSVYKSKRSVNDTTQQETVNKQKSDS